MYFDFYILGIILLPGIIIAVIAQAKVTGCYQKYSQIPSNQNMTASQVARLFLDQAGLTDIEIVRTHGHMSDYYNPRKKIIALSDGVYDSNSIAAIGIACHEVGHAIQYQQNYFPIRLRNLIIPICNFGNNILWFLLLLGGLFYYSNLGTAFLYLGVGVFAVSVILNLITLPVEYNASKRATLLLEGSILDSQEINGVKQMLNSAALTYVASLIISILNLLRLVLTIFIRNRRD